MNPDVDIPIVAGGGSRRGEHQHRRKDKRPQAFDSDAITTIGRNTPFPPGAVSPAARSASARFTESASDPVERFVDR
jgi:hypothetical protein